MLLEQRGALLYLGFDRSSGLGDSAQHILPADNHADDIDDWDHRLGPLPALPRPPTAAHAGELALSLQNCLPCLSVANIAMTPIWIMRVCVHVQRATAQCQKLSGTSQCSKFAAPPVTSSLCVSFW